MDVWFQQKRWQVISLTDAFIMRVEGDLVTGAEAQPGDLLILDRSQPHSPRSPHPWGPAAGGLARLRT